MPFIQMNQARFATELARTQYDKAAQLECSLESAKRAERLYQIRYRAGAVPLQAWLDAQESRRAADIALAATRLSQLQNYTTLCQALGGNPIGTGMTK